MPTKEKVGKVEAREAVVVFVGSKAPEWHTEIVRNRHTGQLQEVPLTEYPPKVPGTEGRVYVYKRGEQVRADHEAVLTSPGSFEPVDE